jgi:hypothetical protein
MNSFQALVSNPSALAVAACIAVAGCGAPAEGAGGDPIGVGSEELSSKCPPAVPDPSLAVPAGNKLAFDFDAIGVQIYGCQASATGFAWVFQAPEAKLYNRHGRLVGKHYAGPTWEYQDGSKVVGAKIAGFTPDPSSIPWLLLGAASHDGLGLLSTVTFIQRLDTVGGTAPAAASCDADHVGEIQRIDYTATYFFYEAGDARACACK